MDLFSESFHWNPPKKIWHRFTGFFSPNVYTQSHKAFQHGTDFKKVNKKEPKKKKHPNVITFPPLELFLVLDTFNNIGKKYIYLDLDLSGMSLLQYVFMAAYSY